MKKSLRILASALPVAAIAVWLATGINRGWTKTAVPIKKLDEVTGIEGIEYQSRFVPGVDFLAAAVLGSGTLLAASFLFRPKQKVPTIITINTP
jgi:hypothetical protein